MNPKTGKDPALGAAPVGRLFWRLALPAIAAQLVNVLYNIVDRVYIGHLPRIGAAALTGVGVTLPAIMIISAFAALVSAGGAPRVSMLMGKGDPDAAERIIGTCTFTLCAVSLALTLVMQLFAAPYRKICFTSDPAKTGREFVYIPDRKKNGYRDSWRTVGLSGVRVFERAMDIPAFLDNTAP